MSNCKFLRISKHCLLDNMPMGLLGTIPNICGSCHVKNINCKFVKGEMSSAMTANATVITIKAICNKPDSERHNKPVDFSYCKKCGHRSE